MSDRIQLLIPRAEAKQRLSDVIDEGRQMVGRAIGSEGQFQARQEQFRTWCEYVEGLLSHIFTNDSLADEFSGKGQPAGVISNWDDGWMVAADRFKTSMRERMRRLESISKRLEFISQQEEQASSQSLDLSRVFIVHGRDEAARHLVARFVEKIGLEAVILGEQVNAGQTIIEKFESHSNVGFAIVLLTPDDLGALVSEPGALRHRARQNVIFEFGYFVGKIGRKRICALYQPDVELPSDIHGFIHIPLDANDGWKRSLAKELIMAGMSVDRERALSD